MSLHSEATHSLKTKYSPFERLADLGYDELEVIRWTTNQVKGPRWMIRALSDNKPGVGAGDTVTEAAERLISLIAANGGSN